MNSRRDVVVAIDVGGTSMKCALVDRDGTVVHTLRRPTGREHGPDVVVDSIADTAVELAESTQYRARAVGLVVPGIVDADTGVAVYAANLGWRDVPLRQRIEARTGLPTALGHDVRAGGLAEARLGAGRGSDELLFIAIGTGIAGAHIVGGRSLTGAHGSAVELGHVVVRPGGAVCGCGQRGCVEAHGSAIAFEKRYVALAGQRATAEQIIAAAGTDAVAAQAWRETIDVLADGLLVAVAMLDPGTIVVGGGLASAGDALLSPLREALRARATFHSLPSLVVAELGDVAGCIGAAILGLERLEAQNEQV